MAELDHTARAHVRIVGRVQGVGYRISTADEAQRRHLTGWVRNLESGAVEAIFQGPRSEVAAIVRWCEDGPPGAFVRDLHVWWDEPLEPFARFEVRPTASG